jgi:hypothetical protein
MSVSGVVGLKFLLHGLFQWKAKNMKKNDTGLNFQSPRVILSVCTVLLIAIVIMIIVDKNRKANMQPYCNIVLNRQTPVNNGLCPNYSNTVRPGMNPAYPYYPPFNQAQQVALNTLTLPFGVSLAGKGTVVSVDPGSPADQAGIQAGDLINRINGR